MPTAPEAVSESVQRPAFASFRSPAWREYIQLVKPGITRLVTIASGVGFAVSAAWSEVEPASLVVLAAGCLVGTAVSSAGANALNQVIEVDRDRLMKRTMDRPLPAGRLDRGSAIAFAVVCAIAGPLLIGLTTNWFAGAIAALTVVLYVCVYTPLKPISPLSTYVGAIPGALPCLIGWAAASPSPVGDMTTLPPWSIFLILAVWQIPHFTAIAMMYREQYRGAGFKPLPDAMSSFEAGRLVLVWAALTVIVSALPLVAMPQLVGVMYTIMAASMGAIFIYAAAMVAQQPTTDLAKKVFLWSIAYLPIVYLALVVDVFLPVQTETV